MAAENFKNDDNRYRVVGAITNDASKDTKMLRVDPATLGLLIAGSVAAAGYSTVTSGTFTTTTTAGVQLVSIATPCKKVTIICPTGNTGLIAVGGSTVSGATNSEIGHPLLQGASYDFYTTDASSLYISLNTANDRAVYNIWN